MALTPEEQKELEQLHSKYSPPSNSALTPDEQKELESLHTKYSGGRIGDSLEAAAPDWLKNAVGSFSASHGGLAKGASLGYAPIEKLPGVGEAMKEHPIAAKAGEVAGGAVPGSALGAGIGAIAPTGAGIGSVLGRIGLNTAGAAAQGALVNPGENGSRLQNAKIGGALGLGTSTLGELIGAIAPYVKNLGAKFARMTPSQAEAYASDPGATGQIAEELSDPLKTPKLQDRSIEAIQNSRKALKGQGLANASKLSKLLTGKSIEIDPDIIERYNSAELPLDIATEGTAQANPANEFKRALQEQAKFKPGTVTDPVTAARQAQAGSDSASVRRGIEAVAPEAAPINKSTQESMLLQEALRRGQKAGPLAFVSTEAPDRVATLARAENRGAGGLLDLGNQVGAAKTMVNKDVGSGVPTFPLKWLGRRGVLLGNDLQDVATDPKSTQAILGGLFSGQ